MANLLKSFGDVGIVPGHVGVALARQRAERLLDLVRARALGDPQGGVEVVLRFAHRAQRPGLGGCFEVGSCVDDDGGLTILLSTDG